MTLSSRQESVLLMRGEGLTYKEIAAHYRIHIGTVETHVLRAIRKMGARTLDGALYRYRQAQEAVIKTAAYSS